MVPKSPPDFPGGAKAPVREADQWKGSGETGRFPQLQAVASATVHLRPPSIDKGVQAFLWAAFFFLYLWLGMLAVGVSAASAFIFAAILAFAIFLFVRIYGEKESSAGRSRARIR
jgi:hypothetical protein